VWPGVVVGDEALTQAIIKLRRALGDDPRAPRYVETIPKRGYRLVASEPSSPHPGLAWRRLTAAIRMPVLASVATALVVLASADSEAPAVRHSETSGNAEARALFTRAQARLLVRGASENEEARVLFRQAIEHDPTFARAYAGLATRSPGGWGTKAAMRVRSSFAQTARMIDPDARRRALGARFRLRPGSPPSPGDRILAQGHRARSCVRGCLRDCSGASTPTWAGRANRYRCCDAAMRLKPDGGYLYYLLLGRAYLFDDDVEQALINLRAAAMRNPVDVETRAYLAAALLPPGTTHARAGRATRSVRCARLFRAGVVGHLPDGGRPAGATARVAACRGRPVGSLTGRS
jgi:tetratricopeptide (TPR) repeat protein